MCFVFNVFNNSDFKAMNTFINNIRKLCYIMQANLYSDMKLFMNI